MAGGTDDNHSRWLKALRTQAKTADAMPSAVLPCHFCTHQGRIFQSIDQLLAHTRIEHASVLQGMDPSHARTFVKNSAGQISAEDRAGGTATPDITSLSLDTTKGCQYLSGKKRPIDTDFQPRRSNAPVHAEIHDPPFSRDVPHSTLSNHTRPKPAGTEWRGRSFSKPSSEWSFSKPSSEWSVAANRRRLSKQRSLSSPKLLRPVSQHQPELSKLQSHDPRYPGLLLQPDFRPISQEQLAAEVKSIYAGLTMVETKCTEVDRAQASQDQKDPNQKLAPEQWQALIALHRTLLHEHHDFFLASQHPSASRALAAKYSMPARMWKHRIHSVLELLRHRLPGSIDHILTFIYLAYSIMALLYETVPAFKDTWIKCLGDLGRYGTAIEDKDLRDHKTWASAASSWYHKAADKSLSVGPLYHHLAIIAQPNAFQQLYYYARSLTCTYPFTSARESILTLLDPVVGRSTALCALTQEAFIIQPFIISFRSKRGPSTVDRVPWSELATFLNTLLKDEQDDSTEGAFPSGQPDDLLLPEDYLIRGQVWSRWYFPENWFERDYDEKGYDPELAETASGILSQAQRALQQTRDDFQRSIDMKLQRLYSLAIELSWRKSLTSTMQSFSLGFMSSPLALYLLIPGAAAESLDTTASSTHDTPPKLLAASTTLAGPIVILSLYGGLTATLLWAKAEGTLAIFMLITAITFTDIRTPADSSSTFKDSGHYIRLAVGLGYIFLMLAFCRIITLQSKQKKVAHCERKDRKHGRIFFTIATTLSLIATAIITAFPASCEYWKSLTGLNPILALSLTTPLSFFLYDLASSIATADSRREDEDEDEEVDGFVELPRVEAGFPNVVDLQDLTTGRWRHLVRGQRRRRGC